MSFLHFTLYADKPMRLKALISEPVAGISQFFFHFIASFLLSSCLMQLYTDFKMIYSSFIMLLLVVWCVVTDYMYHLA